MIVVIGGIKGGTGKTTIALNLTVMRAATSKKVLLVDGDEQQSASTWSNHREGLGIKTDWTTVSFSGQSIYQQVSRMKSHYDDIIIDVGGRETTSQRAAIAVADIYLIPFKPRSLDIWTITSVKNLLFEMKPANRKLKCYSLINQADSNGSDNESTHAILNECKDIKCLDFTIGARKAFGNAASVGLGVSEMKIGDKKAIQEIKNLHDFLYKKCMF